MHDVVIVGAGPAGSHLAYRLAQAGWDVVLLDRARFPRSKSCGGAVSLKAARMLDFDLTPAAAGVVRNVVFSHEFTRPLALTSTRPMAYLVDRTRFDAMLVDRARSAGAVFVEGSDGDARQVRISGDGMRVYTAGREFTARVLVGADGAFSRTARQVGLYEARRPTLTVELEVPRSTLPEEDDEPVRVEYGAVPWGYAWVFPKGPVYSVGIWSAAPAVRSMKLRSLLQRVLEWAGLDETGEAKKARGWVIPVIDSVPRLHGSRVLLVGDAAGLADPLTGEGIYPALLSSELAAEVLSRQLRDSSFCLEAYTELVRDRIGGSIAAAHKIARIVHPLSAVVHRVLYGSRELLNQFPSLITGELGYAPFVRELTVHVLRLQGKKHAGLLSPGKD